MSPTRRAAAAAGETPVGEEGGAGEEGSTRTVEVDEAKLESLVESKMRSLLEEFFGTGEGEGEGTAAAAAAAPQPVTPAQIESSMERAVKAVLSKLKDEEHPAGEGTAAAAAAAERIPGAVNWLTRKMWGDPT